jgi:hypothetical protein
LSIDTAQAIQTTSTPTFAGVVLNTATPLQMAIVTLNQADIQGMYATPKLIVAGVASKVIVPVSVAANYIYNTAVFATGTAASLQYSNTNHGGGTAVCSAFGANIQGALTSSAANQIISGAAAPAGLTASSNAIGLGVYLSNQTNAFTAGNAASSLVITILYMVVPML